MSRLELRGSLGTQVMSLFVHLGTHRRPPSVVRLNVAGDVQDASRIDWLSQLFDVPRALVVDHARKVDLADLRNIDRAITGARLARSLLLDGLPEAEGPAAALHVRYTDRQPSHLDTLEAAARSVSSEVPLIVYGDRPLLVDHLAERSGAVAMKGTPVEDWRSILRHRHLIAARSLFAVTAVLIQDRMSLELLPPDGPRPPRGRGAGIYDRIEGSHPRVRRWGTRP